MPVGRVRRLAEIIAGIIADFLPEFLPEMLPEGARWYESGFFQRFTLSNVRVWYRLAGEGHCRFCRFFDFGCRSMTCRLEVLG